MSIHDGMASESRLVNVLEYHIPMIDHIELFIGQKGTHLCNERV